tara:strand:+ start:334 stop:1548 length:1215 start_codon:yes stop_codon:yes gene_type:complete
MSSVKVNTLPEGWKVEELEKLIDLIQNGISSKQNDEMIGYPVSRIETIQNSTYDKNRIKYVDADNDAFNKYKYDIGDISFSHINSYEIIGKVAIYRGDIENLLHGVNLLRLKFNDKIYSEYGYYFFKSSLARKEYEQHIKRAINQASINQKNLKSILVPFPPLEEQKRLVAKIDSLFTKIDKAISLTEESLKQAKNLLPSVLKEVFEKGKADGWEEKKLGEVCDFSQGVQRGAKLQSENCQKGQVRFLRIIDYTQGRVPPRYIDNPGEKYIVGENDISLVRYGASTGFVCRGLKGVLANNLFRVIPKNSSKLLNDFLYEYLSSSDFQGVIKSKMGGSAMPAISFKLISAINIYIPSSNEQNIVVKKLDDFYQCFKRTQSKLEEQLAYLKQLKYSILSKAFKGEL